MVFILVGLLILVMCIPTETKTPQLRYDSEDESKTEGTLETKLEKVLSAMEGVGEVEVMITTESEAESVFDTQSKGTKVSGVVVVAQGAGNASVNARISEAVKALFSIDVHKISIVKMRSEEEQR